MQMDAGLDTGDMLLTAATPIGDEDTAATLHDRLADIGARLVLRGLDELAQGRLQPVPQPAQGVCYAHKIDKSEGLLDWQAPAELLARRLRAFDPFPGGSTELAGQPLKVWRGQPVPGAGVPGQVLSAGPGRLVVACGTGALELLEVQAPGGRRMPARDYLLRHPAAAG